MEDKPVFKKYYSRLAKEGIIKALVCGLIVGFSLSLIPVLIAFFVDFIALWFAIGIGLVAFAGTTPLFYFWLFRPTTALIARRVDRLGLEERLITMLELEEDQSYVALRQREDAKDKLKTVSSSRLKIVLFKIPVIIAIILAVCSVSAITVTHLNVPEKPPLWVGKEDRPPLPEKEYTYVSVTYAAATGGKISGDAEQLVVFGEDGTTVVAVPEDGWRFVMWSDQKVRTAQRTERKVEEECYVIAFFEPIPTNTQPKPREEADNIIDGDTHYKDPLPYYYDIIIEMLTDGTVLSADVRAMLEAYFAALQ